MFNILATCSGEFGNCCSDYGIAAMLNTSKNVIDLIQMIVPIILLIFVTKDLILLMSNPEAKNGIKNIANKFLAAIIVFFIPVILSAVMNMMPQTFNIGACWKAAKNISLASRNSTNRYISISDVRANKFLFNSDDYESGKPRNPSTGGSTGGSTGATGVGAQRIVNVALAELGNHEGDHSHHKYEVFNGLGDEQPWCAAFVTWCAGQAGYLDKGIFPRFVGCTTGFGQFRSKTSAEIHYEGSGYTPRAGDIIFFSWTGNKSDLDHVGIVLSADSQYVYTIEGNTSCAGEAASRCAGTDGVSKKARRRNNTIIAYVTPQYS